MVIRNNTLLDLLQKAKIPVPPFVGPKIFDYIVTRSTENNCNELNVKPVGRPPKYSNKLFVCLPAIADTTTTAAAITATATSINPAKRKIQRVAGATVKKMRKIKSADEKPASSQRE